MKFTELSQHLHQLRYKRTGRSIGYRMTAMEIWSAAIECPLNGISEILVQETDLPAPFEGLFSRFTSTTGMGDIAHIFVSSALEPRWKEFVVSKELMHCWSPGHTYVGNPVMAKSLVLALSSGASPYAGIVAADIKAIIAAAEVILPLYTLERHIANNLDYNEVAHQHNLHPDVARMLFTIEMLPHRRSGQL